MKLFALLFLFGTLVISCSESKEDKKDDKKDEEPKLTVCDCAKMKESDAPDECFELQKQWKKEFEVADATTKEAMTKELIDCVNKK